MHERPEFILWPFLLLKENILKYFSICLDEPVLLFALLGIAALSLRSPAQPTHSKRIFN